MVRPRSRAAIICLPAEQDSQGKWDAMPAGLSQYRRTQLEVVMDLGLDGKVAMITGGSRGLGRQAALALAREGCKVSICARGSDTLDATVAEFTGLGYHAHGTQADVTNEDDALRFHQETIDHLGQPDILVNNVGGRRGSVVFEETSMEQFREGLEVNLVCAVQLAAMVLPHMKEQNWGRIIKHLFDLRA